MTMLADYRKRGKRGSDLAHPVLRLERPKLSMQRAPTRGKRRRRTEAEKKPGDDDNGRVLVELARVEAMG